MKQLEELEKRIAKVVLRSKELQKSCDDMKLKNKELKEQNEQLKASLMKENSNTASLSKEKDAIKNSIEDLLKSLNTFE